jgi:hypothetical protein
MSGNDYENLTVIELPDFNLAFSKNWVIELKRALFFIGSSR